MSKSVGREESPKRRQTTCLLQRTDILSHSSYEPTASTASGVGVGGGTPSAGIRVRASVVFADVRGFARLAARLEPDQVVRLLDDFFTVATDVAVGHRALIDKVIGDAIMLLYGVPVQGKDDSVRAVRTALDMQRAFLALRNRWLRDGRVAAGQLSLAVGVATGDVVVANVKSPLWTGYTAIGEPVNRAARLCAAARVADSLIDESTYSSVCTALDGEVLFTSREVTLRYREKLPAYRAQRRRAGLHAVPRSSVIDPVCHTKLNPQYALRRRGSGRTHYFCSQSCARRFFDDPGAFAT